MNYERIPKDTHAYTISTEIISWLTVFDESSVRIIEIGTSAMLP